MSMDQSKAELLHQVRNLLARVDALEKESSQEHAGRIAAEIEGDRQSKLMAETVHELRTPLTAILGFATTLLATDVLFSELEQQDMLLIISHEAERMQRLLEELVEMAQSPLSAARMRIEPVPVETILDRAKPQLQTLAQSHELKIMLPQALPSVSADPERIAQVVVNLVKNSVHYSPPKTAIVIRAQPAETEVQVEVIDEGPGIPPDARILVFEPFRQIRDEKASRQGMGLGLAIAKAIIEAHKGRIWVDDLDAPGARICFTLPTYHPAPMPPTESLNLPL